MVCLNGDLSSVVGSLRIIPAGHENILVISFCAETPEATPPPPPSQQQECMMHPKHIDYMFVYVALLPSCADI